MHENEISKIILDCSFKIHRELGPGLLESVYEETLSYELIKQDLQCERQVAIPVVYESTKMEIGFRADIIGRAQSDNRAEIYRSHFTRS